jgi:hypothetical protein
MEALRFARTSQCPWGCALAAVIEVIGTTLEHTGHNAVLAWALANGCPRDQAAMHAAARRGNMEMLELLLQHGCALDQQCSVHAARQGHMECLRWLKAHGVEPNVETWRAAADPSDRHLLHADHESWALHAKYTDMAPRVQVLQWLMEVGCDHNSNDAKALLGNLLCNGWVQRPVTMDQ